MKKIQKISELYNSTKEKEVIIPEVFTNILKDKGIDTLNSINSDNFYEFYKTVHETLTGNTLPILEEQEDYQEFFQKKLKKYGVKGPNELDDEQKKKFFDEVKAEWKGTDKSNERVEEELTAGQKKLPKGLQDAILKKQGEKPKEEEDKDKEDKEDKEKDKKPVKEKKNCKIKKKVNNSFTEYSHFNSKIFSIIDTIDEVNRVYTKAYDKVPEGEPRDAFTYYKDLRIEELNEDNSDIHTSLGEYLFANLTKITGRRGRIGTSFKKCSDREHKNKKCLRYKGWRNSKNGEYLDDKDIKAIEKLIATFNKENKTKYKLIDSQVADDDEMSDRIFLHITY